MGGRCAGAESVPDGFGPIGRPPQVARAWPPARNTATEGRERVRQDFHHATRPAGAIAPGAVAVAGAVAFPLDLKDPARPSGPYTFKTFKT